MVGRLIARRSLGEEPTFVLVPLSFLHNMLKMTLVETPPDVSYYKIPMNIDCKTKLDIVYISY